MGFFGKLFGRRPLVVPAPEPEPVLVRAAPEPDFEDDWDWQVAYARHRQKTEPVARPAAVMPAQRPPVIPLPSLQPRTVIPVPSLPVATDPSQIRVRQDTRPSALPMPRHLRLARGTARHDTQQDATVVARPKPPPIPAKAAKKDFASEAATLTYASFSTRR